MPVDSRPLMGYWGVASMPVRLSAIHLLLLLLLLLLDRLTVLEDLGDRLVAGARRQQVTLRLLDRCRRHAVALLLSSSHHGHLRLEPGFLEWGDRTVKLDAQLAVFDLEVLVIGLVGLVCGVLRVGDVQLRLLLFRVADHVIRV